LNNLITFTSSEVNDQASALYDFMSLCRLVGTHFFLQLRPA